MRTMGRGNDGQGLSKPEHLFSCPPRFFDCAIIFKGDGVSSKQVREDAGDEKDKAHASTGGIVDLSSLSHEGEQGPVQDGEASLKWTCNGCRAVFSSSEEQRFHFKSDFHRLNMKRRVVGKEPMTEEEFEAVAEGQWKENDDMSSISGSDDESDDPEQSTRQLHTLPRSNRIYFALPDVKERFSVWRPIVLSEKEYLQGEKGYTGAEDAGGLCVRDDDLLLRLKSLISFQSANDERGLQGPHVWVVLLAAGGHFAGVVVTMKGGEVLAHHTFHRYVVRAKAGGRQSTQDKTGKAPKSAGASLRRYNEAALHKEIRNLLGSWGEHLQSASHIFVHAPSANSQALFGGENAPLNRNDPRIRRIPFTTRRPTYKEAKRVHQMLAAISYEEETSVSNEITSLIADGKKEVTRKGLKAGSAQAGKKKKENINAKGLDQSEGSVDGELSSLGGPDVGDLQKKDSRLHEAAKSGDCELVLKLLEDGLDPSVKDEGGYTPYDRAGDKGTRNVFRRFMAGHLDMWDWHAAHVPSPLTDELEAAQAAKQAEKDAKRREREKERKKLKKEQERAKEVEKRAAELAAAALASVRSTGQSKKTSSGLPSRSTTSVGYQEALLKAQAQEREMRAAAAEIRMQALMSRNESHSTQYSGIAGSSINASKSCSCCGDSLEGKTPFYRLSYQYCSTTCVQVHRRYLESQ